MLFEVPAFELKERVSHNSLFITYRGKRRQDGSAVLLKVLNQPYPAPSTLAPFRQEYKILRSLDIPGVEKAYALENHREWWMMVLEDFGGRPLNQLGIAGKMAPERLINLALQLTGILNQIHARQVIHKNISTATISFNLSNSQARLTNFESASLNSRGKLNQKKPYQLTGAQVYLSPEMAGRISKPVDYRTDYYSLGATLYELMTGTSPFTGDFPLELVHSHRSASPHPPAAWIEPWNSTPAAFNIFSAILHKLLAVNPDDRYLNTEALQTDLQFCLCVLQNRSHLEASLGNEITLSIDKNAIIKDSLELAQKTDLDEQLQKLMSVLIQNAGAQSGAIISTLHDVSQTIISTLDLDELLNLTIEQLAQVLPYEGAAILIPEQDVVEFRVVRGAPFFQNLIKHQIPIREPTLIAPLINNRKSLYIRDLLSEEVLFRNIQHVLKVPRSQITCLRSWLGMPLIAKDDVVGILLLAHSQPDFYTPISQLLAHTFSNQVGVAIHNARLYSRAQEIAALEERSRLARELHDTVAQALYSINLFTTATRMALETNKQEVARAHLAELAELSQEAMADIRLMIFELRPSMIEKDGLASALQSRLDAVETRAGFKAVFQTEGELLLSAAEESELYRIAQEALNNVIKHAKAERVVVRLIGEQGSFKMTIEDNGSGFDPAAAGLGGGQGIRNIRERAAQIGATLLIESSPGQGSKIIVEVRR